MTVSLDRTQLKLGQEINLQVRHAPEGWSGEINVNNIRKFPIDATRHSLRATTQNGFDRKGDALLVVMLIDRHGREIPLANQGRFQIKVAPVEIVIMPDSDKLGPGGGKGTIRLSAAPDHNWSIAGVPAWMRIDPGDKRSGDGIIDYEVAPNTSGQNRLAKLAIGDAVFEVTQTAAAAPAESSGGDFSEAFYWQGEEADPLASERTTATVSVDKTVVKMGREIQIRTEGVPTDWTGEVLVNSSRHFALDSKLFQLKATEQNGFSAKAPTDLYVLLVDSKGRQIPLANHGRFRITVTPTAVSIDRDSRSVEGVGASGILKVTAKAGYDWSISGAPDWISITSGMSGSGNGTISYEVTKNTTNDSRSATLTVGDAIFEVTQLRPTAIQLPFQDTFQYNTPPPPIWSLTPRGAIVPDESPVRWSYYEFPGQDAVVKINGESPKGGNSILIEKPGADPRNFATQVILPCIDTREGARYKVSAWMKAQNPGPVSIAFGQRSPPYGPCGLDHVFKVSEAWAEYDVSFAVHGPGCDPTNNRLIIQTGGIGGKLWIANFSFVADR